MEHLSAILLALSIVIFGVCIFFVLYRPSKIVVASVPVVGAVLTFLLGISGPGTFLAVINVVWNPTVTLIAIIIFSLVMDEAGFFRYSAIILARRSGGKISYLFLILMGLTAVIAAFFTNDGAVLIMTPIVFSFLKEIKADRSLYLTFLISAGFISDTGSVPLLISNLVNIITAGYFGVDFVQYAARLVLPGIAASAFSIMVLWIYFRKSLKGNFKVSELESPESAIKDKLLVRIALPATAGLVLAYAVGSVYGFPIAIIAFPSSLFFLALSVLRGNVKVRAILVQAPWHIVILSVGLYMILVGMADQGLSSMLGSVLQSVSTAPLLQSVILSGLIFTAFSASMNNLPSVMLGNLSIKSAGNLGYLMPVNVIANDIGPKLTPIGSLATLLWFDRLSSRENYRITYREYSKVGVVITMPVLILTLLVYWLTLIL